LSQRRHVVPAKIFAALASGGGGTPAATLLVAAQRSKRMLLHRAVLDRSLTADAEVRDELVRGYDLLAELQRRSPAAADAVELVTAYPAVTAWAAATLRALVRRDAPVPDPGYLLAMAAAAAVRAGVDVEIPVRVHSGRVMLPSLGVTRVSAGNGLATVRCGPGDVSVAILGSVVPVVSGLVPPEPASSGSAWWGSGSSGSGWIGLHRFTVSASGLRLDVVLDDVDRFNVPAGGDISSVDAVAVVRWEALLQQAWSLLARHHRDSATEVSALLSVLVPLATTGDRQVSATSRDAFGAVALSEPLSATLLAETLVHEVQHLKLGSLLDLVLLLSDDGEARWYAPWREDPRPLSGLLQGAYAHLGVAGFWRRQRWLEPEPMYGHMLFARWREQTLEVVRTLLDSGLLTPEGRAFVQRMRTTLDRWRHESVPGEAVEQARASALRHRRAWEHRHARVRTAEGR